MGRFPRSLETVLAQRTLVTVSRGTGLGQEFVGHLPSPTSDRWPSNISVFVLPEGYRLH